MLAGGLLLLGGLMMFSTGLIGEMMMRTYFESQDRRIYAGGARSSRASSAESPGAPASRSPRRRKPEWLYRLIFSPAGQ